MRSTTLARRACPACGRDIDETTHLLEDISPKPGDVSICAYCGEFYIFDESLNFRNPTAEELVEIEKSPEVDKYRKAVLTLIQRRRDSRDNKTGYA